MDGRSRRRPMHETTGRNPRTIRGDADWLPAGRAVRLERQAVSSRIRVLCSTSCSAPCPPPPPRVARREYTIARGTGRGPAAASADGHQPRRPAESAGTPAGHADLRRVPAVVAATVSCDTRVRLVLEPGHAALGQPAHRRADGHRDRAVARPRPGHGRGTAQRARCRSAAEHLVAPLRCLYRRAVADGYLIREVLRDWLAGAGRGTPPAPHRRRTRMSTRSVRRILCRARHRRGTYRRSDRRPRRCGSGDHRAPAVYTANFMTNPPPATAKTHR
jgi:hypothetical protein